MSIYFPSGAQVNDVIYPSINEPNFMFQTIVGVKNIFREICYKLNFILKEKSWLDFCEEVASERKWTMQDIEEIRENAFSDEDVEAVDK